MPATPDCASVVINAKSGYVRSNTSWILGRVIRDYETWMPVSARTELNHCLDEIHAFQQKNAKPGEIIPRPKRAGILVSVFRASKVKKAGEPDIDAVWASGVVIAVIQLGIACIPLGLFGDWSILLITAFGIILSFTSGSLPQWKREKWYCRRNMDQDYILTRGNGAHHALVVLGDGQGLNFEDLAAADSNTETVTSRRTRTLLLVLAALWIALLICSAGLTQNTWFLLAVGGLGIVHNAAVAGWPRRPENFGIHLEPEKFIAAPKVMKALMETERHFPHVGKAMLPTFFPGKLWPDEVTEWNLLDLKTEAYDAEEKARRAEEDVLRMRDRLDYSSVEKRSGDGDLEKVEKKANIARSNAEVALQRAADARQQADNLKALG